MIRSLSAGCDGRCRRRGCSSWRSSALGVREGLYFWARYWIGLPDTEATRAPESSGQCGRRCHGRLWRLPRGGFSSAFPTKVSRAGSNRLPGPAASRFRWEPIHLVWQDLIVLGVLMLPAWNTARALGRWGRSFSLSATLGASFCLTGPWWMGYVVLFDMGLTIRMADVRSSLGSFPLCTGLRGRARHGIARFPWPESDFIETSNRQFRTNSAARRKSLLGWPFGQLSV